MRSLPTAAVLTAAVVALSPAVARTAPQGAPQGAPTEDRPPAVPADPLRPVPAPAPDAATLPVPPPDDRQVQAPLTTGAREGDIATTTPVPVQPGPDGDAPDDGAPALADALRTAPAQGDPEIALTPGAAAGLARLTAREAEALIGRTAVSREGERIGTVRDFVVQGTDARIEAVILGRGGVLGLGEGLLRVPAEALKLDPAGAADGKRPVTLDLPAAEVERMPGFTYADGATTLSGPRR
ncbi:PRC-barrel domain-containing protein [Rhodospirillum centenum]|uniref:PRC-barrel domain-containing protein n=1 Tax=Rhodospirillum centenum (strain ATCC 51521 / SW) TaxID=414684 RepID=B6IYP6_RHOCS|nr:PRC-barrel domain-containing protein [Rhodospirillum centenum]ACJ01420.1 hypothetical protein RC1_4081 [Rhodospirillum centenum SW]